MSIIDSQLVKIEISTLPHESNSKLRLNYQGQSYDLLQAFAIHKLDRAQRQLHQLLQVSNDGSSSPTRYLLVQEVNYYSLWELDRCSTREAMSNNRLSPTPTILEPRSSLDIPVLELQQASIWLFQELWLQWQDLLGDRQLKVFAKELLSVTPQLQTWVDLDRLLILDPLATTRLGSWSELDFRAFDRQLYHLTQKKLGHQFGTKLTLDIMETMPDTWRSLLVNILDIC